jgi:magnesium chelatase family protein
VNSREQWPQRRITVGLSPASLPKRGSGFDIGIAVAILGAAGSVPAGAIDGVAFLGELGLDGQLRPVRGVLPAVAAAAARGFRRVAVPCANEAEAALVPGLRVLSATTLRGLLSWLRGCPPTLPEEAGDARSPVRLVEGGGLPQAGGEPPPGEAAGLPAGGGPDLADVLGQPTARRAAEICAAGGHHLCLLGPPGAGKTMLAERIPTVLPRLDPAAALEVTAIHSVAGVLPDRSPLLTAPPFCAPHHTATKAAIVGGGSGVIRPGAASLAHRGCLFLDEAPEFGRDVLDALRQPLESGEVVVARSGVTARFPARFTLLLAANPCPCARGPGRQPGCDCTPAVRRRYLARLSGPLLDRVDVKVEFLPVSRGELLSDATFAESSATVAARVETARHRAATRLQDTPWRLNAEIPGSELRRSYAPAPGALVPLERAMDLGQISARGVHRVIRVAWTLADLAGVPRPTADQTAAALGLWLGVPR